MALNSSPSLGPFQLHTRQHTGNNLAIFPKQHLSALQVELQDIFVKRFSILSRILLFVAKATVKLQPNKT
jgi:hypothetical protein